MAAQGALEVRRTTTFMKAMLWLGVLLVFLAALQLYFFPKDTDRFFAWTIKVPLTGAFLGAFYGTSFFLAALSARRTAWSDARVAVLGVQVFVWLTLLMTLLELDSFHLDAAEATAKSAGWLWLIVYIVDPPLLTLAYILQIRRPGVDAPRERETPTWFRALLIGQGAVAFIACVILFLSPEDMGASIWPWPITSIGARAMAAWLAGLGVVLVSAAVENDWRRIRPAVVTYLVLGILLIGAQVRFSDVFEGGFAGTVYLVMVAVMLLTGIYGTYEAYLSDASKAPVKVENPAT